MALSAGARHESLRGIIIVGHVTVSVWKLPWGSGHVMPIRGAEQQPSTGKPRLRARARSGREELAVS